ncbi:MAG: FtsQ-type POTRA domain-containing protein [Desulfuromonadales bacterium]|nr:FtsQ-type POTRA domain-containing protein [Desulfuromonadales bacterium]MBN2792770.1 FtsQ-type POTRA domain-containing protein [Desulfuromonadales bacterium]
MRDLKKTHQKTTKVRRNRRKQEKKPLNLRKFLKRFFRLGVAVFSASLIVVGGFFCVQLMMASDLFRVAQVTVEGQQRLDQQQVVALSDIELGLNTFSLDLGLIGRKIEENPWVRKARVQRIFPRQVVISIVERNPVAIMNMGYLYYLDEAGEIFKVLDSKDKLDFPIITGFDYAKAQEHDEGYAQQLKRIVALLSDLQARPLFDINQVSEIHHEANGDLSLFTFDGSVKIKLGDGDYSRKLDRLERVYSQLQPQLKMLDYIDLNVNEKIIVRIERPKKLAKS